MTPKVMITKGLPGSGKSAWAKSYITEKSGCKRVSKDDLRAMLDNGKYTKANEKFVLALRDDIIVMALQDGRHVIVDDTNLNPVHEQHIRDLVSGLADVEIVDFTHVSIDVCIERDLNRENPVGEKVIRSMYNQWLKPVQVEPVKHYDFLRDAIVVDMDGTLALFGDRNPYSRDFENDDVNEPVASILRAYAQSRNDCVVIIVSGRKEKYREQTISFMHKHDIPMDWLLMRHDDDNRKDSIVKQEIYDAYIKNDFNVLFVLDDRNQTVQMWRSNGLTCLQVADGAF